MIMPIQILTANPPRRSFARGLIFALPVSLYLWALILGAG